MSNSLICTNSKQADVLAAVIGERSFQDRKWGSVSQHPHEVGGYLTIMRKLMSDAEAAWASSRGDEGALDELRKVVAVGVACMEQHGVPSRLTSIEPAINLEACRDAGSLMSNHRIMSEPFTVTVDGDALRQVIGSLIGAPHLLRELQATRDNPPLSVGNPIDTLVGNFNAAVLAWGKP